MSKILINQYYQNLDRTLQFGKSRNEQSIRNHFWALLNEYARKLNYELVPEIFVMGTKGAKVRPDGVVKNLWGLDIGLWESKDEKDDIEQEIDSKIKKGYPLTNILFEDSNIAVLFQRGAEVGRVQVRDTDKFHQLLTDFIAFKSEVIYQFEDAIQKFKADIPAIVETLRKKIAEESQQNTNFRTNQDTFFELCKVEINPDITLADIREMMIQHILTSDIFNKVFDDPEFHRHNTIAAELEKLINILFSYSDRKNLLHSIEHYYQAIDIAASAITDHHEKQKFLKVLYENFYKVYNPKAADRLGVVYTPNEIVSFMVKSTDYLLHKHFGKTLADKNVEILDPATGTGTFICEIIENAIPKHLLADKFKHELHANEVAILPYYIANLNIEYTYKQKMQHYAEFPNLCFVDTLDNVSSLKYAGKQESMFGLTSENTERIRRQNTKKISVVIGNPPYNANQLNENENNKNREYKEIDKRIKDTYIKYSTAQKTKVYDMYARFYRWAMDRLDKNGILSFITNRSFIDSRTFDGFRKCIQDEFSHCYIIDTQSDVRTNPKIAGTIHNVFGIQTGVAIMFLIKKENKDSLCHIQYITMEDEWRKEVKLAWLKNNPIEQIEFQSIQPDKNNNWINLAEDNDWEALLPICSKDVKLGRSTEAIFELFSLGVATNRDEWVYDFNKNDLENKVRFFCEFYENEKIRWKSSAKNIPLNDFVNRTIKWTEELEAHLKRGTILHFNIQNIRYSMYRPYCKNLLYFDTTIIHRMYLQDDFYPIREDNKNTMIGFSGPNSSKPFHSLVVEFVGGLDFLEKTPFLPFYSYNKEGVRKENITDWALTQFQTHYKNTLTTFRAVEDPRNGLDIIKQDIFHYIYAVLHDPAYRTKYELNLKRDFPRIPFYPDFFQWAEWGKQLMELHINYENVKPFDLVQVELKEVEKKAKQVSLLPIAEEPQALFSRETKLKIRLKADKETGIIEIDEKTSLKGIPSEAWEYKLGNRSALEWVLDQYKEKKPSDPTIAEKFNTYRFADYKDHVIDLLKKVCTVSVETMNIINQMKT